MDTIGERIKSIRKQYELTQIEFAESLNISQGTLSEIESGKAKPSFDVLIHLAEKFMVDLNWLVTNREQMLHYSLENNEISLIENYRKLEEIAKEEVLEYLKMRLIRFHKK